MKKCLHEVRKDRCKQCGGSSICIHNKIKYDCFECGINNFCIHKIKKLRCKECCNSESFFCIHKKRKERCIECGGSQICIHEKRKESCKECLGSYFCEHLKQKNRCILCNGSSICIHEKRKERCKQCGGDQLCKTPYCETRKNLKYEGYCLPCFVNNPENKDKPNTRNYKTKEKEVVDSITSSFPNFTWISDKKVIDGCSRCRPDLLLDLGSHIIIVEVDENKHSDYDCICENKRLMELSKDLQHRPIVFIRFNPDDYVNNHGILVKSCWKLNKLGVMQIVKNKQNEWNERIHSLKEQIQYWIDNICEKTIEIIELYY